MKKAFAIITLLTVLLLSACNSTEVPQNSYGGTEFQQTEASATATDDETMTPENVTEAANNSSSQPVTETSKLTTSSTEETVKKTEELPSSASDETVASTGEKTNPVTEQQKPPETTTATKPIEETKPTEPAETTPPKQTTEEPTQPKETEPEPEFDINYWIGYAKNYAASKGLILSSAAVDCWDNPIGAGAHCIYLERDIQSRLNRYANDEDITDVWIWAEPTGNGRYNLYIGYA